MSAVVNIREAGPETVASLVAERRQHVQALKVIDAKLLELMRHAADGLVAAAKAVSETDLPPGVREEGRQLADDLPERLNRMQKAEAAR